VGDDSTTVAEQKAEESGGYNRQHKQQGVLEPKMHTVNRRILSALMPQGDAVGVAPTTAISAAVRNEIRRAEASSATCITLVKDKKVHSRHHARHIHSKQTLPWCL
jgi:hypothetical protein